jgi:hypothetical protein
VRDTAVASDIALRVADATADTIHVRELSQFTVDSALLALGGAKSKKEQALRVPAFSRAYRLFTHTISCFPLREYADGEGVVPRGFLENPSRRTTYPALMARTIGDLICHDRAYWLVTGVPDWDGYPVAAEWLPFEDVTVTQTSAGGFPSGAVWWNGTPYPISDPSTPRATPGSVIVFDGDGTGGWLTTGVTAIALAAALLSTVVNTAEVPSPAVILKNTGADLPAEQVDALLEAWETARAMRATAYLNSTIDASALSGYSPNDLQLVESRNAAATDIARNSNLDPIWVGAGVPGSSLTYGNRVDLRKDLVDLALFAPMSWVTSRLSAWDVTPRGHTVGFDTDAFLMANTKDLADIAATLVPIDVITPQEAATMLDFGGNRP